MTAPTDVTKICGATSVADVDAVAAGGASAVGLWWQVPGGRHARDLPLLATLAARAAEHGVTTFLVTLCPDPAAVAASARAVRSDAVQLHGYQTPAVVAQVRRALPAGTTLVKVLHLQDGASPDARFARAYASAGTDLFLLDSTVDGRVGSTGVPPDPAAVRSVADGLPQPFLLAGGLTARPDPTHRALRDHPGCVGVDVDGGARVTGRLDAAAVRRIVTTWQPHTDSRTAHPPVGGHTS